ncbi:MAG: hypothetical protein ACO30L_04715 [Ilumatobacteraceae bacterium]
MRRRRFVQRLAVGVMVVVSLVGCSADDAADQTPASVCPPSDAADIATGITQERADLLLGFREADAQRCAEELGWGFRVGRRDGESFALTMDYSPQRVNVEVDDDVVTLIGVG